MITSRGILLVVLFASPLFLYFCGLKSDIPDLSAEDLKKMMDENPSPVVIDTRTQFEYARGRIPRSVFVPEERFYALNLILPPEKASILVFYCRGPG